MGSAPSSGNAAFDGYMDTAFDIVTGGDINAQIIDLIDVLSAIETSQQNLVLTARGQDVITRGQDIQLRGQNLDATLTARGQDITAATALQTSADATTRARISASATIAAASASAQATVDAASIAASARLKSTAMQVAQQYDAANKQYDIDFKNYGLNVAQTNFQQRLATVSETINLVNAGANVLAQQSQAAYNNFLQRKGEFDAKLATAQLLAEKSGPQDWVAYNSLINNLSSPEAIAEGVVDPFAWAENLAQASPEDIPQFAQDAFANAGNLISGLNQPIEAEAPLAPSQPNLSGFGDLGSGGGGNYSQPAARTVSVGGGGSAGPRRGITQTTAPEGGLGLLDLEGFGMGDITQVQPYDYFDNRGPGASGDPAAVAPQPTTNPGASEANPMGLPPGFAQLEDLELLYG